MAGLHSRKQMYVATLHIKFRYCKIINGYIDNRVGYISEMNSYVVERIDKLTKIHKETQIRLERQIHTVISLAILFKNFLRSS